MSTLIVEVVRINDIVKHDNADKLEIAVVKGWNCQEADISIGGSSSQNDSYISMEIECDFKDRFDKREELTNSISKPIKDFINTLNR